MYYCFYKRLKRKKQISTDHVEQESSYSKELILEQLSRNYAFFGDLKMEKLQASMVVVVGLGGVGSHCANMLVRSGVNVRLIDFDLVTLSSLNRHALAQLADVGTMKVECCKKHFRNIAPFVKVEAHPLMFDEKTFHLLDGADFVVDCIDNLDTKVQLIEYCHMKGIRVISSMGSGAKMDPTRIQIADISDTFADPLSRAVRKRLKLKGIERGVPVVFSSEKPGLVKLVDLDASKLPDAKEFSVLPNFRVRILPVIGPLPALFGNMLSTFVICQLAGIPTMPLRSKNNRALHLKLLQEFIGRHSEFRGLVTLPMVAYVCDEIWNQKSCLSNKVDNLVLNLWDDKKEAAIDNLVLLTKEELEQQKSLMDHNPNVRELVVSALEKDRREREYWNIKIY